MSLERINRASRPANGNGRTRRVTALVEPPSPIPSAKLLGIPDAEFTPRVRAAMLKMVAEAEGLRQALLDSRARIEEIERAADQDHLLPLLNRRAFVRELTRHIGFTARYGTPASLVYFDLDGFKLINDTYGHAAGDAVLAHFATTLQAHVRDSDLKLFLDMSHAKTPKTPDEVSLTTLAPAFMLSELKRAFEIGFLIFVPFLIIDMAVASILMSMGMMMLPPVIISLPFKLIFFVLVDGWRLIAGSLVQSYMHSPPPT